MRGSRMEFENVAHGMTNEGKANRTFVSGHAQQIFFLGLTSFSSVCDDLDIEKFKKVQRSNLRPPLFASPLPLSTLPFPPSPTLPRYIYTFIRLCKECLYAACGRAWPPSTSVTSTARETGTWTRLATMPRSAWTMHQLEEHPQVDRTAVVLRTGPPRPRRRRQRCSRDGRRLCPRCPSLHSSRLP